MSNCNTIHPAPEPAANQLVVVLKNSKYTYAQFKIFHETVIYILENSDLSALSTARSKNVLFFIKVLVKILETPTRFSTTSNLSFTRNALLQMSYNGSNADHLKAQLENLLSWIDQIVVKQHITIETLLDQFFSLNLHFNPDIN